MEDINDDILAMENKRVAIREELNSLLKTKATSSEGSTELDDLISKAEQKLKIINEQLNQLYDIAIDLAKAAACDLFIEDDFAEIY